jgi:hypothetical protein
VRGGGVERGGPQICGRPISRDSTVMDAVDLVTAVLLSFSRATADLLSGRLCNVRADAQVYALVFLTNLQCAFRSSVAPVPTKKSKS